MRYFKNYLALLAFLIAASQLDASSALITVVKKKKIADETRKVSGFTGIASAGSYNIIITMGNSESLRLEGDAEQIASMSGSGNIRYSGSASVKSTKSGSGRITLL